MARSCTYEVHTPDGAVQRDTLQAAKSLARSKAKKHGRAISIKQQCFDRKRRVYLSQFTTVCSTEGTCSSLPKSARRRSRSLPHPAGLKGRHRRRR